MEIFQYKEPYNFTQFKSVALVIRSELKQFVSEDECFLLCGGLTLDALWKDKLKLHLVVITRKRDIARFRRKLIENGAEVTIRMLSSRQAANQYLLEHYANMFGLQSYKMPNPSFKRDWLKPAP